MTSHPESLARKVGRIDALLFFVIWSCAGAASSSHALAALPAIAFMVVPASALVGWRGAASVSLILAGTASFRRAATEGFFFGAAFVSAIWLWGTLNAAHAAGGHFDGLSPLQSEFWFALSITLLPTLAIGGLLGATHGIALYYLNRWLVRANTSFQGTARKRAAPEVQR